MTLKAWLEDEYSLSVRESLAFIDSTEHRNLRLLSKPAAGIVPKLFALAPKLRYPSVGSPPAGWNYEKVRMVIVEGPAIENCLKGGAKDLLALWDANKDVQVEFRPATPRRPSQDTLADVCAKLVADLNASPIGQAPNWRVKVPDMRQLRPVMDSLDPPALEMLHQRVRLDQLDPFEVRGADHQFVESDWIKSLTVYPEHIPQETNYSRLENLFTAGWREDRTLVQFLDTIHAPLLRRVTLEDPEDPESDDGLEEGDEERLEEERNSDYLHGITFAPTHSYLNAYHPMTFDWRPKHPLFPAYFDIMRLLDKNGNSAPRKFGRSAETSELASRKLKAEREKTSSAVRNKSMVLTRMEPATQGDATKRKRSPRSAPHGQLQEYL